MIHNNFESILIIYGILNGVNLTVFLFVALHFFSYFMTNKTLYIRFVITTIAICSLGAIGLILMFQYAHSLPITQIYSNDIKSLSRFSIPILLIFLTFLYFKSISIQSYNCYNEIENHKSLMIFTYCISFLSLIILCYELEPRKVLLLGYMNATPVILVFGYIAYKTILRTLGGKILVILFFVLGFASSVLLYYFYLDFYLTNKALLSLQFIFSMIHLSIGFLITRYGDEGIIGYFKIIDTESESVSDVYKLFKNKKFLVKYDPSLHDVYTGIKNKEFFVQYQPSLDTHTGQVNGFKAMVYWKHPKHGVVAEDFFAELAINANMMHKIYSDCIEQIVHNTKNFKAMGLVIPVSLGLRSEVMHFKLASLWSRLIEEHDLEDYKFIMEASEDFLMKQNSVQEQVLTILSEKKISVSLANYGVGFSSLTRLSSLNLYSMSIDKSFILDLNENTNNVAIVQSTIQMARGLGINIIADGVQSNDSIELLTALKCDMVRGEGIASPMRASVLIEWMHATAGKPS